MYPSEWNEENVHYYFFFSSRRRHTRLQGDWSSDVCSSDLQLRQAHEPLPALPGLRDSLPVGRQIRLPDGERQGPDRAALSVFRGRSPFQASHPPYVHGPQAFTRRDRTSELLSALGPPEAGPCLRDPSLVRSAGKDGGSAPRHPRQAPAHRAARGRAGQGRKARAGGAARGLCPALLLRRRGQRDGPGLERERVCRGGAPRSRLLRIAPRPRRRARTGQGAGEEDHRRLRAGSRGSRRRQRGGVRLGHEGVLGVASYRAGLRAAGGDLQQEGARRLPAPRPGSTERTAPSAEARRHVPRRLPPRAWSEGSAGTQDDPEGDPWTPVRRAERIRLLLRKRRNLQSPLSGAGPAVSRSEDRADQRDGGRGGSERESRLLPSDREGPEGARAEHPRGAPCRASGLVVSGYGGLGCLRRSTSRRRCPRTRSLSPFGIRSRVGPTKARRSPSWRTTPRAKTPSFWPVIRGT